MKNTEFYLIFDKIGKEYQYICGFKHEVDAHKYVEAYGGKIDTINCIFYKNFDEAHSHKSKVTNVNKNISEFLEMDDKTREQFIQEHPELISKLKNFFS